MANQTEGEVNTKYERVEIEEEEPTSKDEMFNSEEKETPSESSKDEKPATKSENKESKPDEGKEPEKKDDVRGREKIEETIQKQDQPDLKSVPGETPRERALRLEVTRLKAMRRKEQSKELFNGQPNPAKQQGTQLSDDKLEVLKKYDPEELKNLEEVVDVLAEKKGWLRRDDVQKETYTSVANDQLESFLAEHSEYLPENDPDNTLWESFKAEFAMYKQPQNPKEFKKLFNKIHKDIFDIKPQSDLKKMDAAKEKIKVASHAGASTGGSRGSRGGGNQVDPSLRGNLKGFSDKELDELFG